MFRGCCWIWILLLAVTTTAGASDGVVEINQSCAQQGCFSGDTAGFPVTINGSAGRSYRLTSNLTIASDSVTAIQATGPGTSIDLNGFSITGPVTCNFVPWAVCTPSGGSGIGVSAGERGSVRNGSVSGMGQIGISTGFDGQVSSVRTLNNGLYGISVGPGSTVRDAVASGNGAAGVFLQVRGKLTDVLASFNGSDGIYAGPSSQVQNSVSGDNGRNGIRCPNDCLVTGNTLIGNAQPGLSAPPLGAGCVAAAAYGQNLIRNFGGPAIENPACLVSLGANACGNALCP